MSLCRHYVRELRRSVLISEPDLEKPSSKHSSQVLDNFQYDQSYPEQGPSKHGKEQLHDSQRLSAFLRNKEGQTGNESDDLPTDEQQQPPRASFMTTGTSGTPSPNVHSNSSPQTTTVSRADIRASAEKILYTFLLPGAEREIILPQGVLSAITQDIEREGRDDPEVFDAAKDYVFQAMERDAFPGFLRMKALGNLVPPSMLLRLIAGLLALFAAFWAAFVLIFLDEDRATRCWLILPFTVAVYLLMSHQYMLDPILALAGFSEYTFLVFARIKEHFIR
jgi:hypothetical protein